jgi:NAD(P)-dependent dehydrogenase (short-subunit alcohol dehydrogenase family)
MTEPARSPGHRGALVDGCAVVTGGGSGIGRAIALALAREGAAVAILDVLTDGGEEAVTAAEKAGGRASFIRADVSRWDDVDAAVTAAVRQLGPLGIMVNAAGVLDGYAAVDETTVPLWERVIAINLTGTFLGCKRALAEPARAGGGRIINIASVAGLVGAGGGPAYIASKHGVVGLTRYLAVNHADRGVTVNAICPGPIATGLRSNSSRILGPDAPVMRGIGGDEAAIRAVTPTGRRGTVEEIADAAVFLAGRAAAYVTGHTLVVDGGWTAR